MYEINDMLNSKLLKGIWQPKRTPVNIYLSFFFHHSYLYFRFNEAINILSKRNFALSPFDFNNFDEKKRVYYIFQRRKNMYMLSI